MRSSSRPPIRYLLGIAFALVALAALQARRFTTFGTLVVTTFAASPLAFLLLLVVLAAVLLHSRHLRSRGILPVVATAAAGAALWRLFPGNGRFPFSFWELVAALAFCAAGLAFTWRVERARLLFDLYAVYALTCLACYLIPSDIGANIVRLRFFGLPIAALTLALRHWRPLVPALAALALALAWNATPLVSSYTRGSSDPSARQGYWAPTIHFLHGHLGPSYRVEAVDSVGHWAADYLPAAGIPLVRGWFRQDDFPQNALLYGRFGPRAYLRWLHQMAVRYVVLTSAPADYSAIQEARLLRSGHSGLDVVYRSRDATIFAVPSPQAIITGPDAPSVLALASSSIVVRLRSAGSYHLALRYTPYWSAPGACVSETKSGLIDLRARRAGVLQLRFSLTASNLIAAFDGSQSSCTASRGT